MSWWNGVWQAVRGDGRRGAAGAGEPPPATPATPDPPVADREPEAWAILPRVQRVLEAPLVPAARLDVFTNGLAAHRNPSFLAPLTHAVEPSAGGLVNGLADLAPGTPRSRPGAGALTVRSAASTPSPASVQRSLWSWSSAGEESPPVTQEIFEAESEAIGGGQLDTVRWEHPSAPLAGEAAGVEMRGTGARERPLAAVDRPIVQREVGRDGDLTSPATPRPDQSAVSASVDEGRQPARRAGTGSAHEPEPFSTPTPVPLVPLVVARAVTGSVPGPRAVTSDELPIRELPALVTPSVPAAAVQRTQEDSPHPPSANPATASVPGSVAEAPLSGFAAAISTLQQPGQIDDSGSAERTAESAATMPSSEPSDDRETFVTPRWPVQDPVPTGHPVAGAGPAAGASAASTSPMSSDLPLQRMPELPVAPPVTGGSVRRPQQSVQRAESLVPLIGDRGLRTRYQPLSSAVPAPPPVQRISYDTATEHQQPRPSAPAPAVIRAATVSRTVSQTVSQTVTPPTPTPVSPESVRAVGTSDTIEQTPVPEPQRRPDPGETVQVESAPASAEATTQSGSQLASTLPSAPSPLAIVQRQRADAAESGSYGSQSGVSFETMFSEPASGGAPGPSPTNAAAYAATHGHTSVAIPGTAPAAAAPAVMPAVQRLSLPGVPKLPAMPTVPTLPSAPGLPSLPSAPDAPDVPALPSVPDMSEAAAGFADQARSATGVAVGQAREAASEVVGTATGMAQQSAEAVAGAAGAAAGALGGAAGGAAGGDLDEMARRLFEPLSARLRAELWLDRERAGMVTDARL